MAMPEKALSLIEQYAMLSQGDRIVIGLSGGADSVCLTSLLCSLREEYSLTLVAAHVNHGIRGDEAERDESFCRELCGKLGVEFRVLHADIPALARESSEGIEECGRRVRYEFFSSLAGDNGKIAVAHNLSDAAETLIFNLTRGSSLRGAGSISPVRDNVIRPLLTTDRDEIEAYLRENSLSFVTDSTNLSDDYTRNKIRNEIMPILKSINPNAVSALASFARVAREDENLLARLSSEAFDKAVSDGELDERVFDSLDPAIKRRVVREYVSRFTDADVSAKHISDFISLVGTSGELYSAGGVRFISRRGKIRLCRDACEPFSVDVDARGGEISYPYGKLIIQKLGIKDLQNLNKDLLENAVDCDKIGNALRLRSRREGDCITLKKRRVTKSLKKLFSEDGIAPERRNGIAVLDSGGEAVWVDGYGVSAQFAADEKTKQVIIITSIRGEN